MRVTNTQSYFNVRQQQPKRKKNKYRRIVVSSGGRQIDDTANVGHHFHEHVGREPVNRDQ